MNTNDSSKHMNGHSNISTINPSSALAVDAFSKEANGMSKMFKKGLVIHEAWEEALRKALQDTNTNDPSAEGTKFDFSMLCESHDNSLINYSKCTHLSLLPLKWKIIKPNERATDPLLSRLSSEHEEVQFRTSDSFVLLKSLPLSSFKIIENEEHWKRIKQRWPDFKIIERYMITDRQADGAFSSSYEFYPLLIPISRIYENSPPFTFNGNGSDPRRLPISKLASLNELFAAILYEYECPQNSSLLMLKLKNYKADYLFYTSSIMGSDFIEIDLNEKGNITIENSGLKDNYFLVVNKSENIIPKASYNEINQNNVQSGTQTVETQKIAEPYQVIKSPRIPADDQMEIDKDTSQKRDIDSVESSLQPKNKMRKYALCFRGLKNLGNTCYMNASLQCLLNAQELATFFLSPQLSESINRSSYLGHKGDVPEQFFKLTSMLVYDPDNSGSLSSSAIDPYEFKAHLGKWKPLFEGYKQHDAQEFLQFLLDGLHEDLNRVVKQKPSTQKPSSTDFKDIHQAKEFLKSRDDSIITDLFGGVYKSVVTCQNPSCLKESVTFDPYQILPLAIPGRDSIASTLMNGVSKLGSLSTQTSSVSHLASKSGAKRKIRIWVFRHDKRGALIPGGKEINIVAGQNQSFQDLSNEIESSESAKIDWCRIHNFPQPKSYKEFEIILTQQATQLFSDNPQATSAIVGYEKKSALGPLNAKPFVLPFINQYDSKIIGLPMILSSFEPLKTGRDIHNLVNLKLDNFLMKIIKDFPEAKFVLLTSSRLADATDKSSKTFIPNDDSLFLQASIPNRVFIISWALPIPEKSAEFESYLQKIFSIQNDGPDADSSSENTQVITSSAPQTTNATQSIAAKIQSTPAVSTKSIYDCIKHFVHEETLKENEMWLCPSCNAHSRAKKRIDLIFEAMPKLLIIQIKRFTPFQTKIFDQVTYPIIGLDLTPYMNHSSNAALQPISSSSASFLDSSASSQQHQSTKKMFYDLYAIVHHSGSFNFGHYTASILCSDGKWRYFNDSSITTLSGKPSDCDPNTYLLIYRRRSGCGVE